MVIISAMLGAMLIMNIINNTRIRQEQIFLKEEAKLRDRHYDEMKKQYDIFRRIKHDYFSHINTLDVLRERGQTEEMNRYIGEIKNEFDGLKTVTYCADPILDALIFSKAETAKNLDIRTDIKIDKFDKGIISEYELTSLVSNMLQNAIEGAEQYEGEKFIEMRVFVKAGFFVVSVKNSANPPENEFSTVKKDKENHGLGIKIIVFLII